MSWLELVKLKEVEGVVLDEILNLDNHPYEGVAWFILPCDGSIFASSFIFEARHINHNSTIQFSLRASGEEDGYNDKNKCVTIREHLTLAYF